MDRKRALRRQVRGRVANLTERQIVEAGTLLAEVVSGSAEYRDAGTLALFAALSDEVSTRPLFEAARAAGKVCVLPRCRADGDLEFAELEHWSELVPGQHGALEPSARARTRILGHRDLALLPGIAFDRKGTRLGRGKGYYDRWLGGLVARPICFGMAFSIQLIEEVPQELHDQNVDAIATEQGLCRVQN